jgi:hypothetical protein
MEGGLILCKLKTKNNVEMINGNIYLSYFDDLGKKYE